MEMSRCRIYGALFSRPSQLQEVFKIIRWLECKFSQVQSATRPSFQTQQWFQGSFTQLVMSGDAEVIKSPGELVFFMTPVIAVAEITQCEEMRRFDGNQQEKWLLYFEMHVYATDLSPLCSSFLNCFKWQSLFFFPISPCVPQEEYHLSSCWPILSPIFFIFAK